ncbi:MAG TPA: metallophosphoesterase [Acidimicrobiales bacterium]|nr:metallophosphoesterase [Acidimicrobiales bacterium]
MTGLAPGTDYDVSIGRRRAGTVRTLVPPPGRELYRFATVNDVHIGERAFGFRRTIREKGVTVPYPVRCLRAALDEAQEWGAQRIVVKGDLTDLGRPPEFATVAEELARVDAPVDVVLGNHDIGRRKSNGVPVLVGAGLHVATDPTAIDVPGLRIVLAPTAHPPLGRGHVPPTIRQEILELIRGAGTPVLVAVHHYPQRWRFATNWPPGIPGNEAQPLLDAIDRTSPGAVFVSGHSHRHRLHRHGTLRVAELGSTKDFPGTWAGYVVYEGGIRQVVRRVAEPSAIEWTDRTRRTLFGLWGLWSPGTLEGRCWSHEWPSV